MTREEAAEQIYGLILSADDEDGPCIFSDQIEALEIGIEALKQPEIIRCKDCCFFAISKEKRSWCKDMLRRIQPEDFCSHAIRREEEEQCQPKE